MANSVFDPSQYSNLREYVEAVQGSPLDYSKPQQQDIVNAAVNAMYGNRDTSALQSFFPQSSPAGGGVQSASAATGASSTTGALTQAASAAQPPADAIEQLYTQYAGRGSDPGGLEYWRNQFGSDVDANERAIFQRAVAENIAKGVESSATGTNFNSYFTANPDVAAEYLRNTQGMTPDQFAQTHYQRFGVNEGRAAPAGALSQLSTSAPANYVNPLNNLGVVDNTVLAAGLSGGDTSVPGVVNTRDQIRDQIVNVTGALNNQNWSGSWGGGGEGAYDAAADILANKGVTDLRNLAVEKNYEQGVASGEFYNGQRVQGIDENEDGIIDKKGVYNPTTEQFEYLSADAKVTPGVVISDAFGESMLRPLTEDELKTYNPTTGKFDLSAGNKLVDKTTGKTIATSDSNQFILDQYDTGNFLRGKEKFFGIQMTDDGIAVPYQSSQRSGMVVDIMSDPILGKVASAAAGYFGGPIAVGALNVAAGADLGDAIKAAVLSYVAPKIGAEVSSATASALGVTGSQIAGNIASNFVRTGDLQKAFLYGGLGGGVDYVASQIPGFTDMPKMAQNALKDAVRAELSGQKVSDAVIQSAIESGMEAARTELTGTGGGITNRTYDDTITDAGADAFIKAKEVGADDDTALAAANAVTGTGSAVTGASNAATGTTTQPVTTTKAPAGGFDLGEFAGVDRAVSEAVARNTVAIRNDEANSPDEALSLARSKNPAATKFTFGGQEYSISASSGQMASATRDAQLAEIKDLPTFNAAFAEARRLLGPNQTFEWNGKQYSTATFAERPDLSNNVVPGPASTTAGAGRGSYAGYDSTEDMMNKVRSTPVTTEYGGPKILGIPIGTPQDALNTVERMGDVVLDFSRGIGSGFGNFMNQVGTLAHITSASISGGDTTNTLISRDNLLSTLGKDLASYYNNMTTEQSNKEWKNFTNDVSKAPEYLKPFVALQSGIQNFGGVVSRLGTEVGEEVAPLLSGFGIGSKLLQLGASGTAKTVAVTSTLGDMAESAQGSYDTVMDRLKDNKSMTPEEKHWAATQAAAGSMAATAVFGYGANSYLAKSIMGNMVGNTAQKVVGPLAVEYVTEYPESFLQKLNERYAEKGSIDAKDISDANTDASISALLGAKTSGTISGTVQVVGKVSNDFVGADAGAKTGLAVIQSPDGKIGYVPAGDLKVGQEINADDFTQLDSVPEIVQQFNFSPEDSSRVSQSVENLELTRDDRQQASDVEASQFDASQIDIGSLIQSGVDSKSGSQAGVTTTQNPDTGVVTTTNSNNNTTTTVDPNSNTTTQTVVDTNTNTTTETSVNSNTNITTETTTTPETKTTVTTDVNANTQTTVVVNAGTGEVIEEKVTSIPDDYVPPMIDVGTPGAGTPSTTTAATKSTPPKGKTPSRTGAAGLAGGIGATLPSFFGIGTDPLTSRETQKAIDPLQRVMEAQAELENTAMMQQIDPRLLSVLQQRMAPEQQANPQQQFDKDIGALSRLLSGDSDKAANEQGYYSYGSEDSIDDILGGKAANYKEGGYVAPLMAEGGMALPLLAKSGGALDHYNGRENFKEGKHVAGEGDGQSDDIPAWLADGEFVFPADVVSALGNGSTKAGTDKLYEMMHSIRDRARSKGPKDLPPPALKSPLDYLKSRKRSQ